jgi:hypothetical protein
MLIKITSVLVEGSKLFWKATQRPRIVYPEVPSTMLIYILHLNWQLCEHHFKGLKKSLLVKSD